MKSIKPEEITSNVFDMIGKQWMLVSATKDDKTNAMTASWGGLGIMWGKKVAYVFIRESRYTKEFIDSSDKMTLSFFSDDYRKMLNYMGTVSGRTEDKIEKAGLTLNDKNVFEEADLSMVCKKLFVSDMKAEEFVAKEEIDKWYKDGDMHTMYVVEIEEVLVK